MMYESKALVRQDFQGFRQMFLLLGGALCAIVSVVGILNFFNAILTGILVRKREFAMLQAVGMTGRQLKKMLVTEGLLYAGATILLSIVLVFLLEPLVGGMLEDMFWFFAYHFDVDRPVGGRAGLPAAGGCPASWGLPGNREDDHRGAAAGSGVEGLTEGYHLSILTVSKYNIYLLLGE